MEYGTLYAADGRSIADYEAFTVEELTVQVDLTTGQYMVFPDGSIFPPAE